MFQRFARALTLASIVGISTNCTTPKIPYYNFNTSQMQYSVRENEIVFGLNRLNKRESDDIYGTPLQKKHYEVFALSVLNKNIYPVEIPRGGIEFKDSSGRKWEQKTGVEVAKKTKTKDFIPVLITPGMAKGITRVIIENANTKKQIKYDLLDFPNYAYIAPGAHQSGFIIFEKPKEIKDDQKNNNSGTIKILYKINKVPNKLEMHLEAQ